MPTAIAPKIPSPVTPEKVSRTRAAILTAQRAPLTVAEVELPALAVGQVLVQVKASTICGKQLDEISGRRGPDAFIPHLLGHEGAGIVADVGPGVRKVKPGDRVVLHWIKGPGIDAAPPRFSWNGQAVSAGWVTTFSDYTIASENRVTPIPGDVPFEAAALLGCAVTTGLGIVFNNAQLRPGQSIVVFGAGGVGLNVVQGAALVSAHPIAAVDLHDRKLDQAKAFGATHAFSASSASLEADLMALTGGKGFDAAVDNTGHRAVRELCYRVTSNTGRAIFGGVPPHDETISIDSFPIHFGRTLVGVHGGDTKPDVDIPRYLQLYRLGKLKLDEQITHRFPLEQINEAFERVVRGEAGRCALTMS